MLTLHRLAGYLQHVAGYTIESSDYRPWPWLGWTWLRVRTPDGGLVVYKPRNR